MPPVNLAAMAIAPSFLPTAHLDNGRRRGRSCRHRGRRDSLQDFAFRTFQRAQSRNVLFKLEWCLTSAVGREAEPAGRRSRLEPFGSGLKEQPWPARSNSASAKEALNACRIWRGSGLAISDANV